MVLDGMLLVLLYINGLDRDILTRDVVLGEPDGIARPAANLLNQLILVEVAREALLRQDYVLGLVAFLRGLEEEFASLFMRQY